MNDEAREVRSWRHGKLVAFAEFAIVAGIFVADVRGHIFVSKVPYLLVLAWISLRVRGVGWRGVGLTPPPNWRRAVIAGIAAGVGIELLELFVTQPVLVRMTGKMPDLSLFLQLHGNVKLLLLGLALTWTLAAFGEEMVYRGYLMNRVAEVVNGSRAAWIGSLIVVSAVFGFGHIAQGLTGQIENAIDGLLLGALYLACGRNLWAPIIAHGITDTVDMLLLFLGKYPGT
ncbi:MAG: type II CAAX endopeptidase family protein [Acidobacteriota bacterium]|nr:type II CAAX endopeptidase family protein [Acidobacteriota bacterium]